MQLAPNDRVAIDFSDSGVAHVRLTRGDKLNALDAAMLDRLIEAGQVLQHSKGVRAVVLSGEGRSFCVGLDLASMAGPDFPSDLNVAERTHGNANRFQQAALQWRKLPVPVVAAIQGHCLGGGLQIASGADIRVAAPNAELAIMELKWGLVPDMAGFALWRGLVRDDVLRELIYTNRTMSGEEARTLGLVTHVSADPLEQALRIAEDIARRSPHAIRAAKRLVNAMADLPTDRILAEESFEQHALLLSRNQMEALAAGLEGRPAIFTEV